jgi:hypothetical protein
MDTYNRTFPKSIESFSYNDSAIKTKYGLTLIPTGTAHNIELDEFHVLDSVSFSNTDLLRFNPGEIVKYNGNFVNKNFLIKQLF